MTNPQYEELIKKIEALHKHVEDRYKRLEASNNARFVSLRNKLSTIVSSDGTSMTQVVTKIKEFFGKARLSV